MIHITITLQLYCARTVAQRKANCVGLAKRSLALAYSMTGESKNHSNCQSNCQQCQRSVQDIVPISTCPPFDSGTNMTAANIHDVNSICRDKVNQDKTTGSYAIPFSFGAINAIENTRSGSKLSFTSSTSPTLSLQTNTGCTTSSSTSTPRHSNFAGCKQQPIHRVATVGTAASSVASNGATVVRPIPLKAENVVVVLNIKTRCRSLTDVAAEREVIGGSRNPSPEDDPCDFDDEEQLVDIHQLTLSNDFSLTLHKPKVTFAPASYRTYYTDSDHVASKEEKSEWNDQLDNQNSTQEERYRFNSLYHLYDSKNTSYRDHNFLSTKHQTNISSRKTSPINTQGLLCPKPLRVSDLLTIAENDQRLNEYFPMTLEKVCIRTSDDKEDDSAGRIGACINFNASKTKDSEEDDRGSFSNTISCLGSSSSSTISSRQSP